MADRDLPAPDYLRQRLRYDPETGALHWRDNPDFPAMWRTRYSGRAAFTCVNHNGYRMGRVDSRAFLAHRVIWAMYHGEWPQGEIDHLDHDRLNNRIANLRIVDHRENHRNTSLRRNSASGVLGVSWFKAGAKWSAYIMVDRVKRHLGYFDDKQAAIRARRGAEREYGFHANHGVEAEHLHA